MSKKKSSHYWNFRIVTKLHVMPEDIGKLAGDEYRLFSVVEVHYEKRKPVSYGAKDLLSDHETIKGIKWTHKEIKKAFKKPVLDLDNWPNEWIKSDDALFVENIIKNEKNFGK